MIERDIQEIHPILAMIPDMSVTHGIMIGATAHINLQTLMHIQIT